MDCINCSKKLKLNPKIYWKGDRVCNWCFDRLKNRQRIKNNLERVRRKKDESRSNN